jgi:hypothetical protein
MSESRKISGLDRQLARASFVRSRLPSAYAWRSRHRRIPAFFDALRNTGIRSPASAAAAAVLRVEEVGEQGPEGHESELANIRLLWLVGRV